MRKIVAQSELKLFPDCILIDVTIFSKFLNQFLVYDYSASGLSGM